MVHCDPDINDQAVSFLFDILILHFDQITKTKSNYILIMFIIGKLKRMSVM